MIKIDDGEQDSKPSLIMMSTSTHEESHGGNRLGQEMKDCFFFLFLLWHPLAPGNHQVAVITTKTGLNAIL